jgi:hypothetical protein
MVFIGDFHFKPCPRSLLHEAVMGENAFDIPRLPALVLL